MAGIKRRQCRQVKVGNVLVGGDAPIAVQSMNNTDTADVAASLQQLGQLAAAGCEISRLAVLNQRVIPSLAEIVASSPIPLVADIHFDYKLALAAIDAGVAGLRINPGNIGSQDKVCQIAEACGKKNIPIRVGVNSGSLDPELRDKYGGINPDSMCASALAATEILEATSFQDIVISIKASDPLLTIQTYRKLADLTSHPLHVGVTESGTDREGSIRSAVGIGSLLSEGIGDTIRVSLTGDPVKEVGVAYSILRALNLRDRGALLISCPTCGRTQVELVNLARQVEDLLADVIEPIKVAVMGCPVNGPGEAKEADCGIAGGSNFFLIFRKGEVVKKVKEEEAFTALRQEIELARKNYRRS